MSGTIISGLIQTAEPLMDRTSLIRHYDPASSPPRLIAVSLRVEQE